MVTMIQRKIDVEEPDKVAVHSPADRGEGFGPREGNLYFVGLPGSGRRTLAGLAAKRLGRQATEAGDRAALESLCAEKGRCVAVTGADLSDPAVRALLRATGRVFFLMSAPAILARRLGDLSRLEELARQSAELEPHLFQAAHFVTGVGAPLEEMVEDVVEKALL